MQAELAHMAAANASISVECAPYQAAYVRLPCSRQCTCTSNIYPLFTLRKPLPRHTNTLM
jgi:hypothetical protein